jgi:hypothetical protein
MGSVVVSLLVGALGLLVSWAGSRRLSEVRTPLDPHAHWSLGLIGLLPAWLIVFVALLPATPEPRPQFVAGVALMLSGATALIGVIATESALRAAAESSGVPAARSWWLGVLALIPAWAVGLLGRSVSAAVS